MTLLFVIFKYFPFGGLQQNMLRIAAECIGRGASIKVLCLEWRGEPAPGVEIEVVPVRGLTNAARYRRFAQQVAEARRRHPVDKVVGFNKIPGLDVYYAGDPCFAARLRTRAVWQRWLPRARTLLALETAVFERSRHTHILCVSEQQRDAIVGNYGTAATRLHLLPPGIALDRRADARAPELRVACRRELGLAADDLVLLCIASDFYGKGLDRTLRALGAMPAEARSKTHLVVVGDGDQHRFAQLAEHADCEEHVHFVGGRSDVPKFLQGADLLIHPARRENTGNVLLEAIVAGLPVLTTANCGFASYVRRVEVGVVLDEPFEQAKLNRALQSMLRSPLRAQWRARGIEFGGQADIYRRAERAAELIMLDRAASVA